MEPDETSRLLPQPAGSQQHGHDAAPWDPPDSEAHFSRKRILLCSLPILLLALIESGMLLQRIPFNQVLEENICRRLYPDAAPSDWRRCGEDNAVQAELALLRGWQVTFDLIPCILTAIPYGFVADKYGRRPVLWLCVGGMGMASYFYAAVCYWPETFPPRSTWLSSIFMLIGGGIAVMGSLVFSILSDIAPGPYRATTFFTLGAATLVTELIISSLASFLMRSNPWLPISIGLGLYPAAMLLVLCIPETKAVTASPEVTPTEAEVAGTEGSTEQEMVANTKPDGLWRRTSHKLKKVSEATVILLGGDYRIALLLSTLLTTTFGQMAQEVLLQFARKRFKWSWSEAGYLMSYRAANILALLTVILPAANYILVRKTSLQASKKDLLLANVSCIFLLVGNLVISLSATSGLFLFGISIWCFGSGYNLILRSILVQLAEPGHRATLFTTVAIVQDIGAVTAGPLLALSFRFGLSLGSVWTGLPFLLGALLSSVTLAVLSSVRAS